jgi:hypothetical protein
MSEIKVPALKIEFIQELIERWHNEFQGLTITDFLNEVVSKYDNDLERHFVPGDTGVYIDDEVKFKMNSIPSRGRSSADWDKDSSFLIFGTDNLPGLYSYDQGGNKIWLNSVQATDIRIWNYLSLFILRGYTIKRWGSSNETPRLFIKSLSNGNVSRHSILRLYWSAKICYDSSKVNKLELLNTMWKKEDFMTQVTERTTSGMIDQIRYFLEYCAKPEMSTIFDDKSSEGYPKYRKLIKLFLADSNVLALTMMSQKEIHLLLDQNMEVCNLK